MQMIEQFKSKTALFATAASAMVVSGIASAQVDVSDATSAFGDAATAIGLIGVAMVAAAAAGVVYRWVTAYIVK